MRLSWTLANPDFGRAFELSRLNEKRVSMYVLTLIDAAIFSAYYCWFDLDKIRLLRAKVSLMTNPFLAIGCKSSNS